jgi:hypothetical protein
MEPGDLEDVLLRLLSTEGLVKEVANPRIQELRVDLGAEALRNRADEDGKEEEDREQGENCSRYLSCWRTVTAAAQRSQHHALRGREGAQKEL